MAVKTARATLRETQHFPVCRVWGCGSVGGVPLPEKQILSSMSHFLLCSWLAACSHLSPDMALKWSSWKASGSPLEPPPLGFAFCEIIPVPASLSFQAALNTSRTLLLANFFFPIVFLFIYLLHNMGVGSGEWAALTLTHFEILSPQHKC